MDKLVACGKCSHIMPWGDGLFDLDSCPGCDRILQCDCTWWYETPEEFENPDGKCHNCAVAKPKRTSKRTQETDKRMAEILAAMAAAQGKSMDNNILAGKFVFSGDIGVMTTTISTTTGTVISQSKTPANLIKQNAQALKKGKKK